VGWPLPGSSHLRRHFAGAARKEAQMLFFSNRMGCLSSILISLIGTLILLALTGAIKLF